MKKPFTPSFETPEADFCKEELNKIQNLGNPDLIANALRDNEPDISWEVEQLGKSLGFYLEFNRATSGSEKEWIYLIRIAIPGGGPLTATQWSIFDDLATRYTVNPEGFPSLRLTTRQTIQFHWVKKEGLIPIIKTLAEVGLNSLNGCGDNTRNVMACPLNAHAEIFDGQSLARAIGNYFQLPLDPFIKIFAIDPKAIEQPRTSFQYGSRLLNRKFKIGIAGLHKKADGSLSIDNGPEVLTNDLAIVPVINGCNVEKVQIYVGGGQGERNGKPGMATLAQPLTIIKRADILPLLDAVVSTHQKIGDRKNRFWARLKYVIKKQGIDWFRDQVSATYGKPLAQPIADLDLGHRYLHHGWIPCADKTTLTFGAFIENGRLIDNSPNGKLKSMVRSLMDTYPCTLTITPNQDLLFGNIAVDQKDAFEADLARHGFGQRNGQSYSTLRRHSGACVGRDTCRLAYTESERYEPILMDELEKLGWADMAESIGITGCERQCFRPGTKTIGLVGSGLNRYMFKLGGDVSGRHQGQPLVGADDKLYLRSVSRENVPTVIDVLFKYYSKNKETNETLGAFHRRIGNEALIHHLKTTPTTAVLMDKPFNTDCLIE